MSLHRNTWRDHSRSPRRSVPQSSTGGFTLLELLLALAILAVLLTLVTTTFGAALRTMNIFEIRSKIFHSSRVAFSLLHDELQSSVLPTPLQKTNFIGIPQTVQGRSLDGLSFDSNTFRRFPGSLPGTNPVTFDWWVENEAIFHRENPRIFGHVKSRDFPRQAGLGIPVDFTSGVFPLSHDVQNFRLRYYQDAQWVNRWSSLEKDSLPYAVSIELTLQLPGSGDQKFSTLIRLPRGHQEAY